MSEIPSILSYPPILPLDEVPELDGRLVYVVEGYELDGVAILLFFQDGKLGVKIGNFDGDTLDLDDIHKQALDVPSFVDKLTPLVATARIPKAIFYFSNSGFLVDVRTSLNVMVGPGMLKDLCSSVVPTQKIIEVNPLDDNLRNRIADQNHIILKHSSFKVITRKGEMVPLYAIKRSK